MNTYKPGDEKVSKHVYNFRVDVLEKNNQYLRNFEKEITRGGLA